MIGLLRSLRSLILGETWTIPIGVVTALALSAVMRAELSDHLWHQAGGFLLAAFVAATLALSVWTSR